MTSYNSTVTCPKFATPLYWGAGWIELLSWKYPCSSQQPFPDSLIHNEDAINLLDYVKEAKATHWNNRQGVDMDIQCSLCLPWPWRPKHGKVSHCHDKCGGLDEGNLDSEKYVNIGRTNLLTASVCRMPTPTLSTGSTMICLVVVLRGSRHGEEGGRWMELGMKLWCWNGRSKEKGRSSVV